MYIAEILDYDLSYFSILRDAGMKDEDVIEFMEWAFGKVVSNDRREWARKWNRFHGKHLMLSRTPETASEWAILGRVWSNFKAGLLK